MFIAYVLVKFDLPSKHRQDIHNMTNFQISKLVKKLLTTLSERLNIGEDVDSSLCFSLNQICHQNIG